MPEANATKKRCAIYTRKSTEDGLEQDFNSLDAQREACAAYILSQASEGWEPVSELYDDGGWSGGSMKRPALVQLLDDVKAGKVDIIVVYKVDRLTRSLADFAKIVEILDEHEASFVSVTQSFNTTNSMGRLTLNVLLSFAQFEREVTGERIRDKVAASKKKGMWMGGAVPLGYKVQDRQLLIDPEEAVSIRYIFNRYLELKSVPKLVSDLAARDFRTRRRVLTSGRILGDVHIGTGALTLMLQNPIYIGKIRHHEQVYDGAHEPIIAPDMFAQVQAVFAMNRSDKMLGKRIKGPSLLTGMITDPDGRQMSPTQSKKQSRRYRYYSTRIKPSDKETSIWHLPAGDLEHTVIRSIVDHLTQGVIIDATDAALSESVVNRYHQLAKTLSAAAIVEQRKFLLRAKAKVQVKLTSIEITLKLAMQSEPTLITVDAKLVSKGKELRMALAPDKGSAKHEPDPVLLKLIAQAYAARDNLIGGTTCQLVSDYSARHLKKLARLSYLAPDIIKSIVEGSQPVSLTGRKLLRTGNVPLDWVGQRTLFGYK